MQRAASQASGSNWSSDASALCTSISDVSPSTAARARAASAKAGRISTPWTRQPKVAARIRAGPPLPQAMSEDAALAGESQILTEEPDLLRAHRVLDLVIALDDFPGPRHSAQRASPTASCPQAAWMSRPRVSLTVAGKRARSSAALKAAIAFDVEPSYIPVGL
jgi:hypothetical protein